MRILHALSQRPSATGSGIYLRAVLREAARQGHASALLAGISCRQPPDLEGLGVETCDLVLFDGPDLPHAVVGMSDAMPYPSTRFCDLTTWEIERYERCFLGRLEQLVERFRPDLIHSHHLWLLTALIRRSWPDRVVVATSHGSDLRQFRSCSHLAERVRGPCAKLDGIMALGAAHRREIAELFQIPEERVSLVGSGVDRELFRPRRKPPPPPVEILYAGKLSRAKGVPLLLDALQTLTPLPCRLHLVGGGHGSQAEAIRRQASRMGARVRLYGALSQPALADRMAMAHLFVLPSLYEGVPLVLLEALASGCRLVATDLPGVRELFGDAPEELLRRVPLPRLEAVDRLRPADEPLLRDRLAGTLEAAIHEVLARPDPDTSLSEPWLEPHGWLRIFERIENVYRQALIARADRM